MRNFLLTIILASGVYYTRAQDTGPFNMRIYTNVADMVANASPKSANRFAQVLGYYLPGDGGGGVFSSTNAVTSTNVGARFKSGLGNYSWDRILVEGDPITPKMFGAKGDGTQDDTSAFNAMISAASARGFGRMRIPPGNYGVNLVITTDNVVLEGGGVRDVNVNTSVVLFPWDTSQYVIKVGNDTGNVQGFGMRDIAVSGLRGTTNSPGCLYFAGGAFHGDVSFCQFIGGADTVKFKTGVDYPSTLNKLTHCAFWEGTNSTVQVDDTRTPGHDGYCTGNEIANSHINGFNTGGQAIRVIKGRLNMEGVYLDGADNFTILSKDGGMVSCVNCDLENATGETAVLLTVDWVGQTYLERDIARFINGGARIQGKVNWVDDTGTNTTQIPTGGGLEWLLDRASLRQPWVSLPMKFGTSYNPYDGIYQFDMAGTNGPFWFQRADGGHTIWVNKTDEAIIHTDAGNTNTFYEIEFPGVTSADANVRFFRTTTTSGSRVVQIFRGDGSSDSQTLFNAYGDSYLNALTGNFGVGTASPSVKLDVAGTIKTSTGVTIPQGDVWTLINGKQDADSDLTAIAGLSSTGVIIRTGTGTATTRTLTAGTGISISNGTGVSGNPTISATTGVTDGDKGDITVSSSGATWTVDSAAISYAKIQNVTASRLLGRGSSGFGAPQEITLGAGLSLTGTTLDVAGSASGETNTMSNIGGGTVGVYAQKVGVDLQLNTISAANGISVSSNANVITISNVETNTTTIAISDTTSAITTGTDKQYWNAPYAFTLKSVKATLGTVSSSGVVTVNIKKNGTTIFSTRISIDASEYDSTTAATAYVLSTTSFASNDKITFDIDDAGTGAKNVQITLYHTKS